MLKARLTLILLLVICFSLAARLQPRYAARANGGQAPTSVLGTLLGDGRKMVADYFYVQADVYFHSGYYPSVFDQARKQEEKDSDVSHPAENNGPPEESFLGPPKDWIDAFSRHFRPVRHTHLSGQAVGEMLPWMKLSAELDPQRIQTYVVTAYWLRGTLGKSEEAENFLREGLRANPNSPELRYELGRIYLEDRKDLPHARNLFLAALRSWQEIEGPKPEITETGEGQRNELLHAQILGGLVLEETETGNFAQAIQYLETLKQNSPKPEEVQKRIDELKAKLPASAGVTNQSFH